MDSPLYNQKGKEVGTIALSKDIFGVKWNPSLVHQVSVSMMANKRKTLADTKDRAEVSGGGKKPWRQKGTGRARHGSRRSPIWRKGGVTFGPLKEKNFSNKINKKSKIKALYSALSKKLNDGEVLFLDTLGMSAIKTKDARAILKNLSLIPDFISILSKKRNAAFIFLPEKNDTIYRSFKNFQNIHVNEFRNMSLLDVLTHKYLVVVDPYALSLTHREKELKASSAQLKARSFGTT